jgi:hypothetical protein
LAEANVVTVEVRYPVTKLFPFMQAAIGDPILRSDSDDDLKKKNFLIFQTGMAHPKPKRKKP